MTKVDYLTEDTLIPSDQKFVCISFLTSAGINRDIENNKSTSSLASEDTVKPTTLSGIKVRGVFSTYEEACAHAKKLQTVDNLFNVFVGEVGKWLPFDPCPDSEAVKDSEYANDQLNDMMKKYMENQEKAKIYHELRKNELVRKNLQETITARQQTREETQKKLDEATDDKQRKNIENTLKSIDEQIKKMEDKHKELLQQEEAMGSQIKKPVM